MSRWFLALIAFVLLSPGCWSPSPEARSMWAMYARVHEGMTRREVHAVMPAPDESGQDRDFWRFNGPRQEHIRLLVLYYPDGRVRQVERRR